MNKFRIKSELGLFLGLGILVFCLLCVPALAAYNYDGYPVETVKNGTVKGDVYVSYGNNYGLNNSSWSYKTNTFVTNFNAVPTSGVKWAELDVGVWGGSTSRVGWAETKLNDTMLSNETLNISAGLSSNVSCCGSGLYLIQYNCTDVVKNLNNGVIKAKVVTTPDLSRGTSYRLDSRIYGAVLTIVYENGNCYTQYWINKGDLNLHKNATGISDYNAYISRFNGSAWKPCPLGNSTLTVAYFAGDYAQNDYLYFNAPDEADSPYNLSNFNWDRDSYVSKLLGVDVANNMSAGYPLSMYNFDLETFGVKSLMNYDDGSNYAIFWRGHGNDTGESEIYDPPWPGINPETEGYYTPFLAVLKTTRITTYDFSNNTSGRAGEDLLAYRYETTPYRPAIYNNVPSTQFTDTQYEKIKYDDGVFQSDETDAETHYAAHRFVFNTCCTNASNFSAINVTWNGKGWHYSGNSFNGAYLYIWNYNSGQYEELDNCAGDGNENYLIGEKTTNLGNYIQNGQVIVLAEAKTYHVGDDYASHIETDYVKLFLEPV